MIHQRWRDLLFVHWAMPADAVRPLVPRALELDCRDGHAWVTLIPFWIAESRPAGVPRALAHAFLETNLRTYVRGPDGEPGIYFFSLEAESLPAVAAARLFFGLPYFFADMSRRIHDRRIIYTSRRRYGRSAGLDIAWTVEEAMGPAIPGSRDHFLVERYTLYVTRRAGLRRARVRHGPYPLHHARLEGLKESLLAAAGLPAPAGAPLCHHSPGVDVEVFGLTSVPAQACAA